MISLKQLEVIDSVLPKSCVLLGLTVRLVSPQLVLFSDGECRVMGEVGNRI